MFGFRTPLHSDMVFRPSLGSKKREFRPRRGLTGIMCFPTPTATERQKSGMFPMTVLVMSSYATKMGRSSIEAGLLNLRLATCKFSGEPSRKGPFGGQV